jgi:nicotinate-nucleotide pyrophosphorylase (carboxylating)
MTQGVQVTPQTTGLSAGEFVEANAVIARALDEDLRYGPDVTTLATVPADATTTASMATREPGVVAGVDLALLVLDAVLGADGYTVLDRVEDGARLQAGQSLLRLTAPAQGLLTAERTMLNLVCHLSGIATATARWVDAVQGTRVQIRDTRKTLAGLRSLQKYAVRVGGGVNHRMGLGDAALIKDNHVAACGGVAEAVRRARASAGAMLRVEVEVEDLPGLEEAIAAGADLVLLDNMDDAAMAEAVRRAAGRVLLEASGNMTLERLPRVAATGVDYVSMGAVTHSARAVDLAFDLA